MCKNLTKDPFKILLVFSALAIFPLLMVYILQYFFGVEPCKLCIYERIPFFVLAALPLLFIPKLVQKHSFKGFFIVLIAVLLNVSLSFYHWGIENKWFENSLCTGFGKQESSNLEQFFLSSQTLFHNCSEVKFRIMNISLAGWNFFYCLMLFILINFAIARHFFIKK